MSRTRVQPQDIEDRNVNPAGKVMVTDGAGNFVVDDQQGGGGGGTAGMYITDEGVPIGTGTIMDFTGDSVQATLSGTVINVDVTASVALPSTGTVVLYDEVSLLGSVDTLVVQGDSIEAFVSGTSGYIYQTGSAGAPNKILLYDQDSETALEYDINSGGFGEALAAAEVGDAIWMPPATIEGDVEIPRGVSIVGVSREVVTFSGQVTLDGFSSLENVSVIRDVSSHEVVKGIVNPDILGDLAKIINCVVRVSVAGSGTAAAVYIQEHGDVEVWGSDLSGDSSAGGGYAGYHVSGVGGTLEVFNSRAEGSTAPFEQE